MPVSKIKMTPERFEAGASRYGRWNRRQLEALGIPWPLVKGWRRRLMGITVDRRAYEQFLLLKDAHLVDA